MKLNSKGNPTPGDPIISVSDGSFRPIPWFEDVIGTAQNSGIGWDRIRRDLMATPNLGLGTGSGNEAVSCRLSHVSSFGV